MHSRCQTLPSVNYGGFSHVAFCCYVTWKGPCGAFVTPGFSFFSDRLMLPVCCACTVAQGFHGAAPRTLFSWIPRASGVVPPTACGVTAVSRVRPDLPCARCAHQSSVQGAGSDFHDELQNPCHKQKEAWSQNPDVGQRSQCSAGDFGSGHDTQTYVS